MTQALNRKLRIDSQEGEALIEARALALAQPEKSEEPLDKRQYICFTVNEKNKFGIFFEQIDQIMHAMNVVHLPSAPAYVRGVINQKSNPIPVIDLGYFFNIHDGNEDELQWVIIVGDHEKKLGILASQILDDEQCESSELSPALQIAEHGKLEYVAGIHKGEITLLNISYLLNDIITEKRVDK